MTTPIPHWMVMGTRPAETEGLSIVTVSFGPAETMEIVVPSKNVGTRLLDVAVQNALRRRQSTIDTLAPGGE